MQVAERGMTIGQIHQRLDELRRTAMRCPDGMFGRQFADMLMKARDALGEYTDLDGELYAYKRALTASDDRAEALRKERDDLKGELKKKEAALRRLEKKVAKQGDQA